MSTAFAATKLPSVDDAVAGRPTDRLEPLPVGGAVTVSWLEAVLLASLDSTIVLVGSTVAPTA